MDITSSVSYLVAELKHLAKLVDGVDVKQQKGDRSGGTGFALL
jgi:hypothetical protein